MTLGQYIFQLVIFTTMFDERMLCKHHQWLRKESKESFKVGCRLVEIIKSLASSGATRWTKGKGGLGLGASDSRLERCDVCIAQIKSVE